MELLLQFMHDTHILFYSKKCGLPVMKHYVANIDACSRVNIVIWLARQID